MCIQGSGDEGEVTKLKPERKPARRSMPKLFCHRPKQLKTGLDTTAVIVNCFRSDTSRSSLRLGHVINRFSCFVPARWRERQRFDPHPSEQLHKNLQAAAGSKANHALGDALHSQQPVSVRTDEVLQNGLRVSVRQHSWGHRRRKHPRCWSVKEMAARGYGGYLHSLVSVRAFFVSSQFLPFQPCRERRRLPCVVPLLRPFKGFRLGCGILADSLRLHRGCTTKHAGCKAMDTC